MKLLQIRYIKTKLLRLMEKSTTYHLCSHLSDEQCSGSTLSTTVAQYDSTQYTGCYNALAAQPALLFFTIHNIIDSIWPTSSMSESRQLLTFISQHKMIITSTVRFVAMCHIV